MQPDPSRVAALANEFSAMAMACAAVARNVKQLHASALRAVEHARALGMMDQVRLAQSAVDLCLSENLVRVVQRFAGMADALLGLSLAVSPGTPARH